MSSSLHDTRWTLVSRSQADDSLGRAALSELCAAYYAPVVAFLRRDGREEDAARELAHDFFARLLQGGAINGADPLRGKFRSYLLAALKRFAADQRAHDHAAKRGGGIANIAITNKTEGTGAGFQIADQTTEAPDAVFDREWALTVLARALSRLQSTMDADGRGNQFAVLHPWLSGEATDIPQAQAAKELSISQEAVKVAIHRLRKRFRESVREEIAQTVIDPTRVQEELDALKAALRG
jgi:RNA polymerase sigma factor (sigma-70 family)